MDLLCDGAKNMNASVALVLGSDELLCEILLRLCFPHFLVRAALVSKRWLLGCFHDRHPARLLGFCIGNPLGTYEFVPLQQQPLELAAFSRRTSSSCYDAFAAHLGIHWITHCCNGRLAVEFFNRVTPN